MLRFTSFWIAMAASCLLGTQRCEAQFYVLEIPGIFELEFTDSDYPLNNPGIGPHTDFYAGSIDAPLQELQLTFFSSPYTDIDVVFEMPNATILDESIEFDQVDLSIASVSPAGFFGEFEFLNVLYSPSQEFHITSFEVSGTTVSGDSFSATSETIAYVPEPSSALLLSALAISAACRRKKV